VNKKVPLPTWLRCPHCGKRAYPTRKAARKRIRERFPDTGMQAYPCGDGWHIGNPRGAERLQSEREPVRLVDP
jgi:hypothetical protein